MSIFGRKRGKRGQYGSSEDLKREVRDILGDADSTEDAEKKKKRRSGPDIYPGLEEYGIGGPGRAPDSGSGMRTPRDDSRRHSGRRGVYPPDSPGADAMHNGMPGRLRRARRSKGPYLIISCVTILLFLTLIVYIIRFNISLKDDIINSPYNRRQNRMSEYVLRGPIVSYDGSTLAYTETDEEGNETRVYPYGRLFAHVVGFMTHGKSGLESKRNYDLLTSHSNIIDQIVNDLRGRKNKGDTVVTTVNASLQDACYNILGDYRGAIIAMEPKTGAIRAMVSKPDFNPNTLEEEWDEMVSDPSNSQLLNRAAQGLYAPGSTFKILTSLAWYNRFGSFESFQYNCQGELEVGEITVHCYENTAHGQEDVTGAFIRSCNTAYSEMGLILGEGALTSVAEKMLFGQKLPFDLLASRSRWSLNASSSEEELVQTAFGQGKTLVTPYHMALIVSAIANNGVIMKPFLVERIENSAGSKVRSTSPSMWKVLLDLDEAEALRELMKRVVSEGTASALSGRSYGVAGKTGSAEYVRSDGTIGTHSWFVGFSNPDDPGLVVVVIAEDGGAGSTTAVPMAGDVFDAWYYPQG